MIKVFYGNDRVRISEEVRKVLGEGYEVFDGADGGLKLADLVNIFQGNSLFSEKRKILIKDLTPARGQGDDNNVDFYEEVAKYVNTPHTVVIWETTVSQKKSYKDFVKMPGVEARKFEKKPQIDVRTVFEIFDTALVDGPRAVKMLEKVQGDEDPYMFFGLLVSQAIKKFAWRQGAKEKRVLKMLSELDMEMKSSTVEPWVLIKATLLRLAKA